MSYRRPARTRNRRTFSTVLTTLLAVGATIFGVVVYESMTSSSAPDRSSASSPTSAAPAAPEAPPSGLPDRERQRPGGVGEADGAVPDGASVFDDELPAVANLDADLLGALREAAGDASDDGVEFVVNSGWRSEDYQERLLREAVAEYGSEEEAARWVSTPETSLHVSGDAIDLGPSEATDWLSDHGAEYGLCQIYDNEPWHYELRTDAGDEGCPRTYSDPTEDPRMRD